MKFIFSYLKKYRFMIAGVMAIKLAGTLTELLLPYILEHLIDNIVPLQQLSLILLWGGLMICDAFLVRLLNVTANRLSVRVARESIYRIRGDLFHKTLNLSGSQIDRFGLPSLISRMTSDSYNVQNFIRASQTLGIRAPIMLMGGIAITLTMDRGLAAILCVMAPIMILLVVMVSRKGIPLFETVQQKMDDIVRIMRENITGIRVVKALSKEEYETERYRRANQVMRRHDGTASIVMSLPGPIVTLFLNVGLTLVVLIGARRVDAGVTKPGVILAFLTYFNMILMGVMGLNRIFMMMSKANASANRIQAVIREPEELRPVPKEEGALPPDDGYLIFDHVTFRYQAEEQEGPGRGRAGKEQASPGPCVQTDIAGSASADPGDPGNLSGNPTGTEGPSPASVEKVADDRFAGQGRQQCLSDISFSIPKGGTLGIIGATGAGKTSIINLLMRFYDPQEGHVFVDGRDVRTYDKDELHRMFGAVFQNDVIFADTLRENISFGRELLQEELEDAAADAMAFDFIREYEAGFDHRAVIHGANFSGGQKQRILISRALAGHPKILVLDDSSSALDYRTDAALRKAIQEHHSDTTMIVIAQRVSSILSLDQILVLEEGAVIGHGSHEELLETCPVYRDIYETQMGEV